MLDSLLNSIVSCVMNANLSIYDQVLLLLAISFGTYVAINHKHSYNDDRNHKKKLKLVLDVSL